MAFQIGAGLLDACVLAVLARGDTYGYNLTHQVREMMEISESTLYPVLRRLQRDGYLTTYDCAFQGWNRRFYTLTDSGRTRCGEFQDEWRAFRHMIDHILLREEESDE